LAYTDDRAGQNVVAMMRKLAAVGIAGLGFCFTTVPFVQNKKTPCNAGLRDGLKQLSVCQIDCR